MFPFKLLGEKSGSQCVWYIYMHFLFSREHYMLGFLLHLIIEVQESRILLDFKIVTNDGRDELERIVFSINRKSMICFFFYFLFFLDADEKWFNGQSRYNCSQSKHKWMITRNLKLTCSIIWFDSCKWLFIPKSYSECFPLYKSFS
jgi:hypothetical protein